MGGAREWGIDVKTGKSACRLAAVSMVRNEEDVIEGFVRHHLRIFDAMYIADHCSTDRTYEILKALVAEGLPLKICRIEDMQFMQEEIITELVNISIADGCQLVAALDADEILVPRTGISIAECRAYLKNLSPDHIYAWQYYLSRTDNWRENEFILDGAYREQNPSIKLRKVLVGADIWQHRHLKMAAGNHMVSADVADEYGSVRFVAADHIDRLMLAHFAYRSEQQMVSKTVAGWLNNIMRYTTATIYATQWSDGFKEFATTGHVSLPPIENAVAYDLPEEWCRLPLKYTSVNPVRGLYNVMLTAQNIANELAIEHHSVGRLTFILPYVPGLHDDFEASISSAVRYPYDDVQYVVIEMMGVTAAEEKSLLILLEAQPEDISIYLYSSEADERTKWQREIAQRLEETVDGDFVAWLWPGQVLDNSALRSMMAAMQANEEENVIARLTDSWRNVFGIDRDLVGASMITAAIQTLYRVMQQRSDMILNISELLFRRATLAKSGWLLEAMQDGRVDGLKILEKLQTGTHFLCIYTGGLL